MVANSAKPKKAAGGLTDTQKTVVKGESSGKSQLDKFKEAARQLETDDDEERFEERLKKVVRQKPDDKGGDK